MREASSDADIPEETAKSWLKRGRREPEGAYASFAAAVGEARQGAAYDEMELDEFHEHLAAAIRKGSVTAMKLYWQILRAEEPSGPLSELDELDGLVERHRGRRDSLFNELEARKFAAPDTYIHPDAEEAP